MNYSHPNLAVEGKLFDLIPSQLIKAYATEIGLIEAADISLMESKLEVSGWLINQLQNIENNNQH